MASVIGAAAGFSFFYAVAFLSLRILKKEGMGGGDIKLMAMVGAFLGWKAVLLTTFLGSLFGAIIGVSPHGLQGQGEGFADTLRPVPCHRHAHLPFFWTGDTYMVSLLRPER